MLLISSEASDHGEVGEDGIIWHDKHIIHFGGDDIGYSSSSSSDSSNSNNPHRTRRERVRNNLNSRITQHSSNLSSLRSLSPSRTREATTVSLPPPQQRIDSENLHLSTRNIRSRYQRLLYHRLRDLQSRRSEHVIEQVPSQSSRQSALINDHHPISRRRRDSDSSQSRSTRTRSNGSNAISRNHQSDSRH